MVSYFTHDDSEIERTSGMASWCSGRRGEEESRDCAGVLRPTPTKKHATVT